MNHGAALSRYPTPDTRYPPKQRQRVCLPVGAIENNGDIMLSVHGGGTHKAVARFPRPAGFYAGDFRVGFEQGIGVGQKLRRGAILSENGVSFGAGSGGEKWDIAGLFW